jgi:hypothetical protein
MCQRESRCQQMMANLARDRDVRRAPTRALTNAIEEMPQRGIAGHEMDGDLDKDPAEPGRALPGDRAMVAPLAGLADMGRETGIPADGPPVAEAARIAEL